MLELSSEQSTIAKQSTVRAWLLEYRSGASISSFSYFTERRTIIYPKEDGMGRALRMLVHRCAVSIVERLSDVTCGPLHIKHCVSALLPWKCGFSPAEVCERQMLTRHEDTYFRTALF
jgi:hypothetical protein